VWGDLTKEEEVVRIYKEIEEKVGFVDLLICAAGGDIGAAGCDNGRGGRPENDDCLNICLSDIQRLA
jgi:NAD(P)-dependent dehydrogenase (short-subunit alcohol dehydrogenase family)